MPSYRVQHGFQGVGGTADDFYINTFHFWRTDTPTDTQMLQLAQYINAFYTTPIPNGTSIDEFLSPRCRGDGAFCKIYDESNHPGPTGPPVHSSGPWSVIHTPDLPSLPEEVAVALSYRALHSGGNTGANSRARRRGRIYIGPLNTAAMDDIVDVEAPVKVSPILINTMLVAAWRLKNGTSSTGWSWRVMSRMDDNAFDIVEVSVDNAFDTVRGRGTAPTERVRQVITSPTGFPTN